MIQLKKSGTSNRRQKTYKVTLHGKSAVETMLGAAALIAGLQVKGRVTMLNKGRPSQDVARRCDGHK